IDRNSSMSAPATQTSGLPLRMTAARIESSFSSRSISVVNSSRTLRANVLTGALGTSSVTMAMPSCTSVARAGIMRDSESLPLDHHGESHSSRCTHRHEPELPAATTELVEQRRRYAGTRCAERMANRNRATHHIETRTIDLSHRLRESGTLGP